MYDSTNVNVIANTNRHTANRRTANDDRRVTNANDNRRVTGTNTNTDTTERTRDNGNDVRDSRARRRSSRRR